MGSLGIPLDGTGGDLYQSELYAVETAILRDVMSTKELSSEDAKWIKKAIKRPGALTRKAKAAGMSVSQYCSRKGLTGRTRKQCNLARTLKKISKRRKRKK